MARTQIEYTIPEMSPELQRGPDWLRQHRQTQRDMFNSLPLPQRGLHLWRYTDPARFVFDLQSETKSTNGKFEATKAAEQRHLANGLLSGIVTDIAGRDIATHGFEEARKRGVIIGSLAEAVETHHALVAPHLYSLVNAGTGKFEAMNGALWHDGIFIHVPDNVTIDKPIHLLRQAGGANSSSFPRLLVTVGRNTEVTLIDEYGGGPVDERQGVAYANGAAEIAADDDSRVRYISLQRLAPATRFYQTHRARMGRGAQMLTIPLVFGGTLSKQNFGVILNGPGADSRMYGLLFGSGFQHFDNHTLHHHASGRTTSDIDFKVVLRDRALSAYTGLIRIEHAARGCEAYQENRNLLLTEGARAETIPELEILNEDVSCSHGATLGPIDPLLLFYLGSRGIPHRDAVRMVVSGFVASTLEQVPGDIRDKITAFVDERLENL
ncbi:MAG: Fe-S cluster assembly protein SufD [Candidatus Zixiibacteriota bacterium]